MTSEEVKAAIERLQTFACDTVTSVIINLIGSKEWYYSDDWCAKDLRDTLVALLRQADPDTHIELPVDADGEVIRIGDEMDCGEHFGVQEVEGFIHGAVAFTVCDSQPARICTCPAHMTHHYHRPTVEDVLLELVDVAIGDIADKARNENMTYNDWAKSNEVIAEYADKLREVMADDDHR